MKVFLLDNYDSFTFNIVQLLETLGVTPVVKRASDMESGRIREISPDRIIISPGPMQPENHYFIRPLIRDFYENVPILGICLGMQAVNIFFGGKIIKAPVPVHGKESKIFHSHEGIFKGIPSPFTAARYHSLVIDRVPQNLRITASTEDNIPMAIKHESKPVYGVQFHPESYLSKYGTRILRNFLEAP